MHGDSLDNLIERVRLNVNALDKTKTKEENHVYLTNIKQDGREILEGLLFKLILSDCFFGEFAVQLERYADCLCDAPAAVTYDGRSFSLIINPIMFIKYTKKEMQAIIIHELYHILFEHLLYVREAEALIDASYSDEEKQKILNIAADASINQYIEGLPDDCITLAYVRQLASTEEIEEEREMEYYVKKIALGYKANKDKALDELIDTLMGSDNNNGGEDTGDEQIKSPQERGYKTAEDGINQHVWEIIENARSADMCKAAIKRLVENANTGSQMRGASLPGHLTQQINELLRAPKVKWSVVLKRMFGSVPHGSTHCAIRPDRRDPFNWQKSGKTTSRTVKIIWGMDTSGSMSNELVDAFAEVQAMLRHIKHELTIVECDTEIERVYKVKDTFELRAELPKVTGGGGTRMGPLIEYANSLNDPNLCLIICSDFMIEPVDELPRAKFRNLIWLGTPEASRNFNPPQGRVLYLND